MNTQMGTTGSLPVQQHGITSFGSLPIVFAIAALLVVVALFFVVRSITQLTYSNLVVAGDQSNSISNSSKAPNEALYFSNTNDVSISVNGENIPVSPEGETHIEVNKNGVHTKVDTDINTLNSDNSGTQVYSKVKINTSSHHDPAINNSQ